jgi:hypothetical protein
MSTTVAQKYLRHEELIKKKNERFDGEQDMSRIVKCRSAKYSMVKRLRGETINIMQISM